LVFGVFNNGTKVPALFKEEASVYTFYNDKRSFAHSELST
jgi:hypothetical protein